MNIRSAKTYETTTMALFDFPLFNWLERSCDYEDSQPVLIF
jgi:hypothetical protein